MERSLHELRDGVAHRWMASGATQCRPGGDEAGVFRATWERGVNQSLVGDLTFLESGGVHLHWALRPCPELGIFPMVGWAARDRTKLRRESHWESVRESLGGFQDGVEG